MTTDQSIDSVDGPRTGDESAGKLVRRRRLLEVFGLVAVIAGGIWWWRYAAPLSAAERELVGTWTLPLGPAPHPNAVQQFVELRSNRTLIWYGRRVASGMTTPRGGGTWRLQEGVLVWERTPSNATRKYLEALVGQGPRLTHFVDSMKFLRSEGDTFFVEASDGSEAMFVRVTE